MLFHAPTTIFNEPEQRAEIVLQDGQRMVVLMRGLEPRLAPPDTGGEYLVDFETLMPDAPMPVAVLVVDLAHVPVFLKLKPEAIEEILDNCQRMVDGQ